MQNHRQIHLHQKGYYLRKTGRRHLGQFLLCLKMNRRYRPIRRRRPSLMNLSIRRHSHRCRTESRYLHRHQFQMWLFLPPHLMPSLRRAKMRMHWQCHRCLQFLQTHYRLQSHSRAYQTKMSQRLRQL